MKGHGNYKGWRAWGTEPKPQFLLPRMKGKKSWNARISTAELSGRMQLSLFVKKLLVVLCMHTQHHDNPRSLFQTQTAAYSSYAGSVFYPGYTFQRKSFTKSLCGTLLCRQEKASHM